MCSSVWFSYAVRWLKYVSIVGQLQGHFAYVQLAGYHIGDKASAVFLEEDYLFCRNMNCAINCLLLCPNELLDIILFGSWRYGHCKVRILLGTDILDRGNDRNGVFPSLESRALSKREKQRRIKKLAI